jgi:glycosyltransferase involved in cell wall biosynthesis
MKVLYLCPDAGIPVLGRKGASVHVREMVSALKRAGHDVVLAAPVLNKSPWEKPAELDAPLMHLRPGATTLSAVQAVKEFAGTLGAAGTLPGELRRILFNQELAAELQRRFDSDPPDFIYERASIYGTAGVALARAFQVPLLLELNAPLAVEQGAYRGTGLGELAAQAEHWALSQADAVLAVSGPLREHVISLGIDSSRVHVLPNGVNPAMFHPAPPDPGLRARWRLGDGPVLGFLGGLRPWHGVEVLPELLARLAPEFAGLRLVVAGDGPLRSHLEGRLRALGLADRAVFTGTLAHEEVPGVVRLFDVALAPYPSLDHAFYFSPLKLFEYMACGVPVVASHSGQIAEVVRDGETGLLYPPGDLEALTAACARVLGNRKLTAALGQAAAAFVRREFTWDRNAQRVVELVATLGAARQP